MVSLLIRQPVRELAARGRSNSARMGPTLRVDRVNRPLVGAAAVPDRMAGLVAVSRIRLAKGCRGHSARRHRHPAAPGGIAQG
jgi:hypothetical protein